MARSREVPEPEGRPVEFRTASGLPRERVYGSGDVPDPPEIGEPGGYPFTRGLYPDGSRARFWTFRQNAGFGTAPESNRQYPYLLPHGTPGPPVAFDLPTQIDYDSTHP